MKMTERGVLIPIDEDEELSMEEVGSEESVETDVESVETDVESVETDVESVEIENEPYDGELTLVRQFASFENSPGFYFLQEMTEESSSESVYSEESAMVAVSIKPPKRSRVICSSDDEGPTTSKKADETLQNDTECCTICFEQFSTSGLHRLSCLSCGHCFGLNCIEKWLKAQKAGKCPTCNLKATKKDVRLIYHGKSIQILDNSELEQRNQQIQTLRSDQEGFKLELAKWKCRNDKNERRIAELEGENDQLKKQIKSRSSAIDLTSTDQRFNQCDNYQLKLINLRSIEVCHEPSCRSMDYSLQSNKLVVSCQQKGPMFSPFGLKRIDQFRGSVIDYIPVHEQRLRDCVFSTTSIGHVLTTGEDSTLRVTSIDNIALVKRFSLPSKGWCCNWRSADEVSVGLSNGKVLLYDLRGDDEPIVEITNGLSRFPVLAVCDVPAAENLPSGTIVCSTKQVIFYEYSSSDSSSPHVLIEDEGPISSFSYDKVSGRFMVTFRCSPNRFENVTHKLYRLVQSTNSIQVDCISTWRMSWNGQKMLTRNALFSIYSDKILSGVFDESQSIVTLFDWNRMQKIGSHRLPQSDVMQIIPLMNEGRNSLISLTQTKLHFLHLE